MEELKDIYTARELAKLLELRPDTIRKWIKDGKVKAIKFNGAYCISKEEVERILEAKGA